MARGCARKKRGLFPDLGQQLVQIVRCGRALARLDLLRLSYVIQQAVVRIVEQFALLLFLDALNQQPQLLAHLIVRIAEKIGDAGMNIEDRIDAAQPVFPRLVLVIDKSGSKWTRLRGRRSTRSTFALIHFVEPERSGLKRLPVEQANQPARRDGPELRSSLGNICELKCRFFAQRNAIHFFSHRLPPSW
jgi:hypothetical protein